MGLNDRVRFLDLLVVGDGSERLARFCGCLVLDEEALGLLIIEGDRSGESLSGLVSRALNWGAMMG
jgi:hypothetical protein